MSIHNKINDKANYLRLSGKKHVYGNKFNELTKLTERVTQLSKHFN